MSSLAIEPLPAPPDATIRVPGSKSFTNRALLCAGLADGRSRLTGALFADDTDAMVDSLRRLGVRVLPDEDTKSIDVDGRGGRFKRGPVDLDVRLAATAARFLAPALALGRGQYRLDSSEPLRRRPMGALIDALRSLGVTVVDEGAPGHLPVSIEAAGLAGGSVELPGDVSSQFVSGLLLTAPYATDELEVRVVTDLVSRPYLDVTVAVMHAFGAIVENHEYRRFVVTPWPYQPTQFAVEPDASAASYFFAAAAISGGRVRVEGLGSNAVQGDVGFVRILERMGAEVSQGDDWTEVRGRELHGIEADMSDLSDTAQTLAAVAVFADGPTRATGIGFIRNKETDRIAAVVRELKRCGIEAAEEDDGFVVHPGRPGPARVETYDDHRMAMSFALLGLRAPGIEIADPGCVAKTYPNYFEDLDRLRQPARR